MDIDGLFGSLSENVSWLRQLIGAWLLSCLLGYGVIGCTLKTILGPIPAPLGAFDRV